MCGRFNVTSDPLTQLLMDLVGQEYPGQDNHNTAPTANTWIIREVQESEESADGSEDLKVSNAQWWLIPSWTKVRSTKYSMFNARRENLRKSPAFRGPFKQRRCAVPVTGYYEWVNRNGIRQPYYIRDAENEGLLLAGIWDRWWESRESYIDSFAIVTTAVAEDLEFLHHRQPVMLRKDEALAWMDSATEDGQLDELCDSRVPMPLSVQPVSEYVNNTRHHGPQCLEVIGDEILVNPTG